MANRRMFSVKICQSYQFLNMSAGAQALYLAILGMADDDGIFEIDFAKRIAGRRKKDVDELLSNRLITVIDHTLNIGYVMNWHEFNDLKADRCTPSNYRSTLVAMFPDIEKRLFKPKRNAFGIQNVSLIKSNQIKEKDKPIQSNESMIPADSGNSFLGDEDGIDDEGTMFDGRITVKKFNQLSPEEQDALYEKYWGDDSTDADKTDTPVSVEELRDYCDEKRLFISPEGFFVYWNSEHWQDAKGNKITNWKKLLEKCNENAVKQFEERVRMHGKTEIDLEYYWQKGYELTRDGHLDYSLPDDDEYRRII